MLPHKWSPFKRFAQAVTQNLPAYGPDLNTAFDKDLSKYNGKIITKLFVLSFAFSTVPTLLLLQNFLFLQYVFSWSVQIGFVDYLPYITNIPSCTGLELPSYSLSNG